MPFDARVFQVLIASPGDVKEEREVLAQVIYEWNHVNSRDRGVVLLPLRWETHATPEMGSRPQAIINSQVVDYCDMAVGVFWTRLGTPTGDAESGTAEELARVGNAGKPVMLYFSRSKVDLAAVDLDEYKRLLQFKNETYPQGLVEDYASLSEFRDKFARQLAMKMRDLVAVDAVGNKKKTHSQQRISLSLAHGDSSSILPDASTVELIRIICTDYEDIPDLVAGEEKPSLDSSRLRIGFPSNPDYYRHLVDYYCRSHAYGPLRLAVTSLAEQGARDLYMEIKIGGLDGAIEDRPRPMPTRHKLTASTFNEGLLINFPGFSSSRIEVAAGASGGWHMKVEVPVVQARRTVVPDHPFWIIPERDCDVSFDATVYSSDSTPFSAQVQVSFRLQSQNMTWREIVNRFEELASGSQ